MTFERILLPGGRTRRTSWWLGMVLLSGLGWVAGRTLYAIFGDALFTDAAERLLLLSVLLLLIWAAGILSARRFRDRDLDPAPRVLPVMALNVVNAALDVFGVTGFPQAEGPLSALFNIIFVAIGLWLIVALGILRGTEGANRFGEDPRVLAMLGSHGPQDGGRAG